MTDIPAVTVENASAHLQTKHAYPQILYKTVYILYISSPIPKPHIDAHHEHSRERHLVQLEERFARSTAHIVRCHHPCRTSTHRQVYYTTIRNVTCVQSRKYATFDIQLVTVPSVYALKT